MQPKTKAILLNAFVLPGLGHLHLERRKIGFSLVAIVLLCIMSMSIIATLKAMNLMMDMAVQGIIPDIQSLMGIVSSTIGSVREDPVYMIFLVTIILVWLFGIFDVWRTELKPDQ